MHSGSSRSALFKAAFSLICAAVLLAAMNFVALDFSIQQRTARVMSRVLFNLGVSGPLQENLTLLRHLAWALWSSLFYFVVPALLVILVYGEPLSDYGFSPRGFFKHIKIYLALLVPVLFAVAAVSHTQAFQLTYPFYHDPKGLWDLAVWESAYCIQFFALEFFFRGFFLHSMKRAFGPMAILVMAVPYCMIHFQKPVLEAYAAIIAGCVLGTLSLLTNNIWGGVFIHCCVAMSMDAASLWVRGWTPFH